MKDIRKNIEIRRFIEWSKIVRGKPIQIKLYELIYFELVELWIETNKLPLRKLIYETINSKNYYEKFVKGNIFQEYINQILETPCDDKSGYYNPESREILTKFNIKELYDIKFLIKSELDTVIMIDRYNAIYTFCKLYEEWCLKKKSEQVEDITKKERFDVTLDLPLKISNDK
ncbi:hypothetical protein N9O17_02960 [Candidatus Pelagibacter sp.]|nr:hypothetical protein [Candidatus Pelagibacter sp.]